MAGIRGNKSELARKDADFRELVHGRMARKQMNQTDLGRRVGCTQPNISRRFKHPELMTIKELRKWAAALDFTAEEVLKIIM